LHKQNLASTLFEGDVKILQTLDTWGKLKKKKKKSLGKERKIPKLKQLMGAKLKRNAISTDLSPTLL
jgi:hypothetical protein